MSDDQDGTFIDPGYTPPPETRPPEHTPQPWPAPPPAQFPAQYPAPPPAQFPAPSPYFGYPALPQVYTQPPPRRRRGLVIGICVSVAVVLAVVAALLVSNNDGKAANNGAAGHTLTIPGASGEYTRMTGNVADRLAKEAIDSMTANSPSYREAYSKAKIGIYSHASTTGPALIFIGLAAADDATIAQELSSQSASIEVDEAFLGAGVSDTIDVDAGPLGGVMRCAKEAAAVPGGDMCVWVDRSSLGLMLIKRYAGRAEPGAVALRFRGDAEH